MKKNLSDSWNEKLLAYLNRRLESCRRRRLNAVLRLPAQMAVINYHKFRAKRDAFIEVRNYVLQISKQKRG